MLLGLGAVLCCCHNTKAGIGRREERANGVAPPCPSMKQFTQKENGFDGGGCCDGSGLLAGGGDAEHSAMAG